MTSSSEFHKNSGMNNLDTDLSNAEGKLFSNGSDKSQSISNLLTLSLIAIVTMVTLLSIGSIYFILLVKENRDLEQKADATLRQLSGTLEMPLWNYNFHDMEYIAKTFAQDELVVNLKIADSKGSVFFSIEKDKEQGTVTRSGDIYHEKEFIGHIEFSLNNKVYEENRRKMVYIFIIITSIILITLSLFTGKLFRHLLQTPLERLNDIVRSYGKGKYHTDILQIPYLEFKPFERVLIQMGKKIKEQFDKRQKAEEGLRKINIELEERVHERTIELESQAEKLIHAKKVAESAATAKSDFLARMSHEIRTPMNAVIGLTNLVLKTELTLRQREYLSDVKTSSNHLLNIINDILDYSKIEADKLELARESFKLEEIMEKVSDIFKIRAADKHIELFFMINKNVPQILEGDSTRIGQILINLVANAVKFTKDGEIIVSASCDTGASGISDEKDECTLRFSVRDTGGGIPEKKIPELFQPFTQADSSVNRLHEGTGLGLTICQRLVEKMGGGIWVDSTIGKGSTFFFTIKVKILSKTLKKPYSFHQHLRKLNVLVMGQRETSCKCIKEILLGFDYTVSIGQSITETVKLLETESRHFPYDMIIIDNMISQVERSGLISVVKNLKILPSVTAPKIIVIIPYDFKVKQPDKWDKNQGIDGYLYKPVSSSGLFSKILEIFDQEASQSSLVAGVSEKTDDNLDIFSGTTVLLVEDNELNRKFAKALLNLMGTRVDEAHNGKDAVKMLSEKLKQKKSVYNAVLMDIEMPEMDGYTATRIIRSTSGLESVPIIAMTAHALKGMEEKCLDAGMNDYVPKPIDETYLKKILIKHIRPELNAENIIADSQQTGELEPLGWDDMPEEISGINLKQTLIRLGGNACLGISSNPFYRSIKILNIGFELIWIMEIMKPYVFLFIQLRVYPEILAQKRCFKPPRILNIS